MQTHRLTDTLQTDRQTQIHSYEPASLAVVEVASECGADGLQIARGHARLVSLQRGEGSKEKKAAAY